MSEKWRPILGVEAILLSVVSLLSDPNLESPANIDASVILETTHGVLLLEISFGDGISHTNSSILCSGATEEEA